MKDLWTQCQCHQTKAKDSKWIYENNKVQTINMNKQWK